MEIHLQCTIAFEKDIPVVNEDWALTEGEDPSSFKIENPNDSGESSEPQSTSTAKVTAKRKIQGEDEEEEEEEIVQAAATKKSTKKKKLDDFYPNPSGVVYEDYACMLTQANIQRNNNKFYVIQLIERGSSYTVFTRWGRIGEDGKYQTKACPNLTVAIRQFETQFKSKTGNNWADRDNFVPKNKKYTPVELDEDSDDDVEELKKTLSDHNRSPMKLQKKSTKNRCFIQRFRISWVLCSIIQ